LALIPILAARYLDYFHLQTGLLAASLTILLLPTIQLPFGTHLHSADLDELLQHRPSRPLPPFNALQIACPHFTSSKI
jgi:hypothetical protein